MTLEAFETLARTRRSVRNFRPDPIDPGLLERILECGRWAPSGYNLQPTHVVVVTDPAVRQSLRPACMGQRQVEEAPAVLVFAGDRDVARDNFDAVLQQEREAGAIGGSYEQMLRKIVPLAFERGPAGLGRVAKAAFLPFRWLTKPTPSLPAVHMDYWLAKQVMLPAMNVMLAAHAAGLATVPMEGFDGWRVRSVLGLPSRFLVTLVLPIGYAGDGVIRKTRLPLERMVHRDRYGQAWTTPAADPATATLATSR